MPDEPDYEAIHQESRRLRTRQKHDRIAPQFDNAAATAVSMPMSAGIGMGCTVVFLLVLWPFVGESGSRSLPNLFLDRGWVPYVLTFFMFWAFAILGLKLVKLLRQREAMHFDLLPREVARRIDANSVYDFEYHLNKLQVDQQSNFLAARIRRGLSFFGTQFDQDKTAHMLASQSDIDATTVESSYTLVKVFIAAIPILGFIGTVMGISEAVANFAGALGSASDLAGIKDQLPKVTGGLGVAFDTTLLALVMSLMVMFPASILQKHEDDLLNAVDDYCNEYFLKRLDDGRSGGGDPGAGIDRLDALQARIEEVQTGQVELLAQVINVLGVEEAEEEDAAAEKEEP